MPAPESVTSSISWNPSPTDTLLIAGTEADVPTIETLLATLPELARGQVFIEVQSASDARTLVGPGRVMICWLARDRGQALQRSMDAWLSEMLPVDISREHTIYAWIASQGAARTLSSN
ncbi:MAG: siderophore-interacting protein [Microbacteriaceae bacterium]|nr:siderophore-interacting protein [Microbacteriaceae bacterium]